MKTVYAIVGDYYHVSENVRESLNQALKPMVDGGQYQLEYISEENLTQRLQSKPAAVVLFKEDRLNPKDEKIRHWLTEEISEAICRFVEEGGGFLTWHSGLASYPPDSAFIKMLRGYFEYHPTKHQMVSYSGVLPTDPSREVAFEILDEHYFVFCDEANTNIFLKSDSVDGHSIGGWYHSYGQGKICCLTPAHNKEGLLHEGTLELLRSSVQYCCG
ncbi:ThuA domain-containing protein [Paenibacillus cremeus]|uniref:ThuA domain-containing protein n=1 Tax=Paenibacillus cremeus TaxID=2163881 RepID=A0A559K017_9BACL|nr:ThuA domain-containing protein [Paenibacillus cremeus]